MKLPDYFKCVDLKDLLVKMGVQTIPELEPVTFVRSVTQTKTIEIPNPQVTFSEKLKIESVPLQGEDVRIGSDGLLEVNGLKACAYIKKQRQDIDPFIKTSGYRYHLCNCQTIERMINGGRVSRYVSTTRNDGWFPVIDQTGFRAKEVELKLELCKNCRTILASRGMLPNPYTLERFFQKYQPEIPHHIKRTEQVLVEEPYAPNHEEIARKYKEKSGYTCQYCDVNCSSERGCLHLHHLDGDGQNNNHSNLRVYCTDCHSKEFQHQHMLKNPQFLEQIRIIHRLRKEQRIPHLHTPR